MIDTKAEDRRVNSGLVSLSLIAHSKGQKVPESFIDDIWIDLVVRLHGPPIYAPISIGFTVLP